MEGQDRKFREFEEKALDAVSAVGTKVDRLIKLKMQNLRREKLV